ncbi:MAG: hypothetical protein QXT74_01700 [Candidatus Nezhaarchaeales archaeon]
MVEGPTAKAYAIRIRSQLEGEVVRDFFARSRRVYLPIKEVVGRRFVKSDSLGKNILLFLEGVAIRVHLMMFGSIHIYSLSEPLLKPKERVRLMIAGDRKRLVAYDAPIVEVDEAPRLMERLARELGPDPLSEGWSRERAIENILRRRGEKVGAVLLEQSVIAGIGNILRNEALFRAGVSPERPVDDLSLEEAGRIVEAAELLSREFLRLKLQGRGIGELLFVYNRSGRPCKVCSRPIKFYMQRPINRKTFVCEGCQK